MSRLILISSVVAALCSHGVGAAHAADTLTGKVSHVTLHRTQALVTRTIDIGGPSGLREIVISELPERIVPGSLFAESDEEIEVRAVQFRARAVGQSPREEVRQLQSELDDVNEKIQLNQKLTELASKQDQYLDKLEEFVAPTANMELKQGVLNASSLEQLTKFSFAQRKEVVEQQMRLANELKGLQEQANLLNRKLAEVTSGNSKSVREAVLFLQKNDEVNRSVRLNYLVSNCGWSPSYVIRGRSEGDVTSIEYNGLIHQLSGEDWKDVELTLSTASPTLSAAGPGLAPFEVTLAGGGDPFGDEGGDGGYGGGYGGGGYGGGGAKGAVVNQSLQAIQENPQVEIENLYNLQNRAVMGNLNTTNFADNARTSWDINKFANDLACAALVGDESVVTTLKEKMDDQSSEPSLSYTLASRINLDSRTSQQIVRIVQTELPSSSYHVATPVLTSYVFREAELTNNSREDLLAGPITVYLDNKFVGRGEIPTVARGQTFVVGFGADPQLRARRELADRTEGVNGGNRELRFEYRVVIENYKEEKADIRVFERLPKSVNSDIRVTLADGLQDSLSGDKVYRRTERSEGILRWDIEAPARSLAENARMIDYAYTVEYDRKYKIALPSATAQLEQFKQLQRGRAKR